MSEKYDFKYLIPKIWTLDMDGDGSDGADAEIGLEIALVEVTIWAIIDLNPSFLKYNLYYINHSKEMIDDVNDPQKSESESECEAPSLVGGSFVEMDSSCESFNDLETYSGSSTSE